MIHDTRENVGNADEVDRVGEPDVELETDSKKVGRYTCEIECTFGHGERH
jgi:hypothetical protein